jgi:TonB family protein
MKRVFGLIVIFAVASIGASAVLAQSGRARRDEPAKGEHAEKKSEQKDKPKDKAQAEGQETEGREKVLTSKEVSVRPIIKAKPPPDYPHEARSRGVQGDVKLRIILGSNAKVSDQIDVLRGLPYGVTEEAIKAAHKIVFEPAQKDGRPVSQYMVIVYNFRIY